MGLFSGKSNTSWETEFDRRAADPKAPKDRMTNWRVGGSETRVADDDGVMRRRNGAVCCGCGKGRHGDSADPENVDLDKPNFSSHHHEEETPRRFLGLF
jgi:hypothetical protein